MTIREALATGLVIGLALVTSVPVRAEEQQNKDQEKANISGEALIGVTTQDEEPLNSAKFGEYREVPNGFTAEHLFLNWTPKEGFFFDLLSRLESMLPKEPAKPR